MPFWNTAPEIKRWEVKTPRQMKALDQWMTRALSGFNRGVKYDRRLVPGASDLQSQAFGMTGGLFGSPTMGAQTSAIQSLLSGQPTFTPDPAARESMFQQSVLQPAMRDFSRNIMPSIMENFNRNYTASSGMAQRQALEAGSDLANRLGAVRGQMTMQDELSGRAALESAAGRQLAAAPLASQQQQDYRANLGMLAGLGGTQRQIEAQRDAARFQKWQMRQPFANPYNQMLFSGLSVNPYVVGMSQGQQGWGQPLLSSVFGPLGNVAGGIGNIATS